jgi:hypothetical protein
MSSGLAARCVDVPETTAQGYEMSRTVKVLIQLGLAAIMLFSFGAAAYDPGGNDDGDENLGIAVILGAEAKKPVTAREHTRVALVASPAGNDATLKHSSLFLTESSRLTLPNASNVPIPLRT